MKKSIFLLLFAVSCALTVSVYAVEDETVNALPPCNSYDNAIYREVYKNFSGETFGRVRKGENGNFFVTVGGIPMEFAIEDKAVRTIGLKDYTDHQELGEIGQDHLYSFESPIQDEQGNFSEDSPGAEKQSDYDIFNPDDGTPELPDFGESQLTLPNGEQPVVGQQEESGLNMSDELFTGSNANSAKTAIVSFYEEASEDTKFRLSRWIASRPLISEMMRSGDTLTGKVRGIVNEYDITINNDGTITLEDTAWMEFPQWSALKR